ncbi:unnamed protein product [Cochlearia groenlandica]
MSLATESTGEVVTSTAGNGGGITVVRSDAPSDFHIAPRSESSNPSPPPPQSNHTTHLAGVFPPPQISTAATAMEGFSGVPLNKKRGRPRKYGPDGAVVALSPKPISSMPAPSRPPPLNSHIIDFSATEKRGKINPIKSFNKTKYHHQQIGNLGEFVPSSIDGNFIPHVMTVNAGEDVTMKIISFSQQGPRAICVLSANGVVSSVTLNQPDSSGGTLTYEGRFEILSLSGSFMPNDIGGTRSRTGGMSISLASFDGRVIGGGVAGLLVAASPVQVVVGSFLAGTGQEDQKPEK